MGQSKMTKAKVVARSPHKEWSWQKAQSAPLAATALMRIAPDPIVFKPCLAKLLADAKLITGMSLGRHGADRTPVRELRKTIGRLEANSRDLHEEGRCFVWHVTDCMRNHLGCVNTDKSFKPFAVVLECVLELARMS